MNKQIKGLLYFYITSFRFTITIFWAILLFSLVLCLVIAYFLSSFDDLQFAFILPFATYINVAIIGFLTVKEVIPFSLKLGATRKNLFTAIGLFFLIFALFQSLLSNIVQSATELFIDVVGLNGFMLIHPAELLGKSTFLNCMIVDTTMMLFLLALMYIIGLLFYRGGLLAGGIFIGVVAVALLFGVAKGWIIDYIFELYQTIDLMFFAQILGVSIVIYAITFLLIRKVTTVKVR